MQLPHAQALGRRWRGRRRSHGHPWWAEADKPWLEKADAHHLAVEALDADDGLARDDVRKRTGRPGRPRQKWYPPAWDGLEPSLAEAARDTWASRRLCLSEAGARLRLLGRLRGLVHGHQIEHELAQLVLTPKDAQSVSQLFYGPKPALIPPPALNPAFDDVQLTRRRLLRGTLFFYRLSSSICFELKS